MPVTPSGRCRRRPIPETWRSTCPRADHGLRRTGPWPSAWSELRRGADAGMTTGTDLRKPGCRNQSAGGRQAVHPQTAHRYQLTPHGDRVHNTLIRRRRVSGCRGIGPVVAAAGRRGSPPADNLLHGKPDGGPDAGRSRDLFRRRQLLSPAPRSSEICHRLPESRPHHVLFEGDVGPARPPINSTSDVWYSGSPGFPFSSFQRLYALVLLRDRAVGVPIILRTAGQNNFCSIASCCDSGNVAESCRGRSPDTLSRCAVEVPRHPTRSRR